MELIKTLKRNLKMQKCNSDIAARKIARATNEWVECQKEIINLKNIIDYLKN